MVGANFPHATSILCLLALVLNANLQFVRSITIQEPTFSWDGFRLNIDYQISDSIVAEKVTYDVVSDKDCEGGIIDDEEIETQLIERSENSVRVSLLMNPESIHAARYVTHHNNYAIVGVCSRLWVNKPDDTFEPVTATRDDYILIKADLEGLEGVIEVLEDKAKRWGVDVYRCNDSRGRINSPPAIRNGEKLRLCITPTQQTLNDGVHLGTIKSFHFEREGVVQDAVTTYGFDDVTNVLECDRGSDICIIETVLDNDFFFAPGEVKGEGVFFMQWGKTPEQRLLRSVKTSFHTRSLYEWYEQGEIVSEKVGLTQINIQPVEKVYTAEAFACDNENMPSKQSTLNETDYVKICIKPTKEAREAGVYMNALESFSYALANDERTQEAIDSYGRIVEENQTAVDCSVGASVCSINSTLKSWFFDEDATMVATGYAVLQYGDDRRRMQVKLDNLDFAGRSQVETYFDTIGRNPTDDKSPTRKWFDDIFKRYDMSENALTALYISGIILIVLITLCCCAGCIFFFLLGRGGTKEVADNKHTNIDIKINQQGKEISDFADEPEGTQPDYGYGNASPMSPRSPYPRRNSNGDNGSTRSPYPRRYSNSDHPRSVHSRRNSNGDEGSMRSPRPRRRGSNDYDQNPISGPPLTSPKPRRRGSNGDDGSMRSPKPRRRGSNGDDGSMRSPKPRRRGSNGDDGSMRSPKPSDGSTRSRRRGSNDGSMRSPKPRRRSIGDEGSTRSRRRGSNGDDGSMRSPKPRRRGSNGDDGSMRSPKPRRRGSNGDDGSMRSPKPSDGSTRSRRRGSNDGSMRSPKPRKNGISAPPLVDSEPHSPKRSPKPPRSPKRSPRRSPKRDDYYE